MNDFDQVIFGKKTFSSLLKDAYDTTTKTEKQINELITNLKPFIKTTADAMIIVPLIKQYMEVKVQNDEHLVKMASVIQRAISASKNAKNPEAEFQLTDDEKKQLLIEVEAISIETKVPVQLSQQAQKVIKNET
jgi:hypothetical protein